ncbi:MAG: lipoate--protein ligase, partial [Firmicutes bacterium]|nr:lipoate--protein ligase [Bacillota bacterium]
MITDLYYYEAPGLLPYRNQALEEYLLRMVQPGELIFYLWQNQRTVVIGRNQNGWKECRVELLQQDHGYLARRLSGGGAVFHDIGNLNFTFITTEENYHLEQQLEVIANALAKLDIKVVKSGRNDL